MNNGEAVLDDLESLFETDDEAYDEDDESYDESAAEFWPGFPLPPIPGLTGGGRRPGATSYGRPPGPLPFVTQQQFNSALGKVRRDVKANAAATAKVARSVASVSSANAKQSKQIAALRREQKKAQEMSLVLFLLTRPKLSDPLDEAKIGGVTLPDGARLQYSTGEDSLLLPLMLMGGLGGGGDSNNMFLMLALAGGI